MFHAVYNAVIDEKDHNNEVKHEDEDEEENEDEEKNDDNKKVVNMNVDNNKIVEFIGSINAKQGWLKCLYCERYHPNEMHLPGLIYCGHCWGWLNSNSLDLENYTYNGTNTIGEVFDYLKKTFKLHDPTKCVTTECVYNKIIAFEKKKKLHMNFCVELGFVKYQKKPAQSNQQPQSNKKNFNIGKKTNNRINYNLSHISI